MKKLTLLIVLLSSIIFAQKYPIAGRKFVLEYSPVASLKSSTELKLVYVFDYWSEAGQPEQGHTALFNNVLHPDSGRKHEAVMIKKANKWFAEIEIPADAKLLSYYLTDGTNNDYNNEHTYIKFICDEKGKPVQGARFRNIDFMIMAGKTKDDIIKEIAAEIKDYPNHFLAYFVYWKYRLETAKDYTELSKMKKEIDKQFTDLKSKQKTDPDMLEALAMQVRVNDEFFDRFNRKYGEDRGKVFDKLVTLCSTVPEDKRSASVNRIYNAYKKALESRDFGENIIDKAAPDFEFVDLNGDKIKLSGLKGKYVLLDFWGMWCGPCVSEIPNLVKAYNTYRDKGFQIVSISSDGMMKRKSKEELAAFAGDKGMNWLHCYDTEESAIHKLYKISHWPTLYLVDKDGTVIKNESVLRGTYARGIT